MIRIRISKKVWNIFPNNKFCVKKVSKERVLVRFSIMKLLLLNNGHWYPATYIFQNPKTGEYELRLDEDE